MKFDVITIFPEIFDFYFKHSIIKKAQEKGIIKIRVHNLRDWTLDKHKTADDKAFGGGRGMVVKVEPIFRSVSSLTKLKIKNEKLKTKKKKVKIVLFTPRGKKFNQKMATQLAKLDQLILICGRYEGVDERVAKYIADQTISIGDYVLMGGELPALVLIETVARLIPGVIGKSELLGERITKKKGFREYPQYTRPEIFEPKPGVKWKVPKVLLSGNHKKIEEWRKKRSKIIE
ncbi:tRNA (guanosine(37)-N1)-methyltransferase TrmD [Patescibacteria group bacterium]|nr:tRNA (guanosine(37)-N1)-methyltransferase TrmD [Patescibacteria group bacterium]